MLRTNNRGATEFVVEGQHLNINSLRPMIPENKYIQKDIPLFPHPEFHVKDVCHITTLKGLKRIMNSSGLKAGRGGFIWWGLHIAKEEIAAANNRFLRKKSLHPENHQFLSQFTTSPVFQEGSRYGNFKFTFPLEDLMQMYQEQICGGTMPVLRIYKTTVYKQEIMYSVVVHSAEVEEFDGYPRLPVEDNEGICAYRNGQIVWHAEAICQTHRNELIINEDGTFETRLMNRHEFFVWDHVTLAFHIRDPQTLEVDERILKDNLYPCEATNPFLQSMFERLELQKAEEVVASIKQIPVL
ncbi:uncharacterized protein LOC117594919 [Esox lucius]|uniref:uncharacterized protein LOC117594919 n=1 Tax=Esox lucius TaxID=8010 RepID=UPI001476D4B7|nr:uncharacterized protein LOC117594919 [Esox lucius]